MVGRRVVLSNLGLAALLAASVLIAYARTFQVPYIFDDGPAIPGNETIRHFATALFPVADTTVSGRPVLNLSFAANYAVSGAAVWSYHAANLAIHILASLALFGIVRRTLVITGVPKAALIGFFTALLWGLHPLLTESVTYLVQRAESLMALFYLATLYCFIRGAAGGRWPWFALGVSCCFLGMGTKEVMVSAPLIVLLYDRTFVAGSFAGALGKRWGLYCGLACSWLLLGFLMLSTHGRTGTAGFGHGMTMLDYGVTQLWAVFHYLRLSLWPAPLVFDYGRLLVAPGIWVIPYGLGLMALGVATLWALVKRPVVGFLGVCFFAVLAPTTSFIPVVSETIAEQRMYLALAPVVVLAVVALQRRTGRGFAPLCAVLAGALLVLTLRRNETYRSLDALWSDTVAKEPVNDRAHNNYGYLLSKEPGHLDEAIAQFREAIRINPEYARAHLNLADGLVRVPGRLDEAIAEFEISLRLKPDQAEACYNLGLALMARPGRVDDAIASYERAIRIQPVYPQARYNLGCALGMFPGRAQEAAAQYEEAIKEDPSLVEAHFNLGCVLVTTPGKLNEAIAQFEDAVRLKPNYVPALLNLATALDSVGRDKEAAMPVAQALRAEPGNETALRLQERVQARSQ